MRDRVIRRNIVFWTVGLLLAILLLVFFIIMASGETFETLYLRIRGWYEPPSVSRYEMVTYPNHTEEQREFPIYLEGTSEEDLVGTVIIGETKLGRVEVSFDLSMAEKKPRALIAGEINTTAADGAVDDYFAGIHDSLQQMKEFGYSEYFILLYNDGLLFLGGYKDGEIAVLPMWERVKGMEYLYSHFLEPMPLAEAERCHDLWYELYGGNPDKFLIGHGPLMAFDDPPQEVYAFAPLRGRAMYEWCWYRPNKDPRN